MSAELVLITGISGFIGYRVLQTTLGAGYVVRGVVRSQSKVEVIKDALGDATLVDKVDFVVVDDMAIPKAFDHLMEGVSYVIHVASPMDKPSDNYERDMFVPAIDMTINALSAAAKSTTVKRVVVTSSVTPLLSGAEFLTGKFSKEIFRGEYPNPQKHSNTDIRVADDEINHYDTKGKFEHPLLAYIASKTMSLEAAENFIEANNRHFDTVFLMPSLVVGANGLAYRAEDTLSSTSAGAAIIGLSVHIDDVAKLHVLALKAEIPAGRYLVSSEGAKGTNWNDAFAVLKKHFPESVGKVFVAEAERYVVPANFDTLKTQRAFEFEFANFEEQTKSAVGNYLGLLAEEA
ncbi:hypothetical protein BKA65DRAFT_476059 [Rhexocercosporidium sp. MPI-PUGE-AT-0058]|nr:hypothetical protein BKA65DRAFT_476059 [Rhexocercosporidium sp. MPI-PUGE-AT-0058]